MKFEDPGPHGLDMLREAIISHDVEITINAHRRVEFLHGEVRIVELGSAGIYREEEEDT